MLCLTQLIRFTLQIQWYPKTDSGIDHYSQDYYSEVYLMHKFWKYKRQAKSLG